MWAQPKWTGNLNWPTNSCQKPLSWSLSKILSADTPASYFLLLPTWPVLMVLMVFLPHLTCTLSLTWISLFPSQSLPTFTFFTIFVLCVYLNRSLSQLFPPMISLPGLYVLNIYWSYIPHSKFESGKVVSYFSKDPNLNLPLCHSPKPNIPDEWHHDPHTHGSAKSDSSLTILPPSPSPQFLVNLFPFPRESLLTLPQATLLSSSSHWTKSSVS